MTTKATDSVLNLVSPPISNMVLSQGTLNNTTIGVTVPNVGYFTENHATRQFINSVELVMLSGDTTFYVSPTGSDIPGNGLTALTPWLTRQYAFNYLLEHYHLSGHNATIQLADGTYHDSCFIGGAIAGQQSSQSVTFQGNTTTPANCLILNDAFALGGVGFSGNNCAYNVKGFKFTAIAGTLVTSGNAIWAGENSIVFVDRCEFADTSTTHMVATFGGAIYAQHYTITGSANQHIMCNEGGLFYTNPGVSQATIDITGTPIFPAGFVVAANCSYVRMLSAEVVITGTTTGRHFDVSGNAVINTFFGGANFFPGSIVGVSSTGGQYI